MKNKNLTQKPTMKYFMYLLSAMALFLTIACNQTKSTTTNPMEITGTIQEQGMTSYQYGTHTLTNSETFYAVKSDSIDLNNYLNQEVTITAEKVEGYPVDGGPEYLRVLSIEE